MRWTTLCGLICGCVSSNSKLCSDGLTCPETAFCDEQHHMCVTKSQLDDCAGQPDLADCPLPNERGNCQQSVCLPVVCGNLRVDSGEMCDDGNIKSKDGCSDDCSSTETCGNGFVDLALNEACDDRNHLEHDGCSSACAKETAAWTPINAVPHSRFQSGGAYDAALDRVVIFGGRTTDQSAPSLFQGDVWTWNGQWTQAPESLGPGNRSRFGLAYDAARKLVVVEGGLSSQPNLVDTWAWNGSTWTRLPDGPPRNDHSMAYDARREKIVLFGGGDIAGFDLNETWELDASGWTKATPTQSPPARRFASMVYDPDSGKVVLYGGCDFAAGCTAMNDLWEYDGTTWAARVTSGAPSRYEAALAYDRVGHQLVELGGVDETSTIRAETYLLSGTTWTAVGTNPITARFGSILVDDHHGGLLLFGGDGNSSEPTDTWRWSAGAWKQLTLPTPRIVASIAYDPDRSRVVLFGGRDNSGPFGDTWELTNIGWHKLDPTGPLQQSGMTFDAARSEVVRFGGFDGSSYSGLTAVLVGSAWQTRTPVHSPSARNSPLFVYDARTRTSILFGGAGAASGPPAPGNGLSDETWSWDGTDWTQLSPATVPPKRLYPAFGYDPVRETVVMFGGSGALDLLDDTWIWDGTDWHEAVGAGQTRPPKRDSATMAWNAARQRLVLTGGTANVLETWEWDGTAWTQQQTATVAPWNNGGVSYPLLDGSGIALVTGEGNVTRTDSWQLVFSSGHAQDNCTNASELDGDLLAGCADPDCWTVCSPQCPPGSQCLPPAPTCGDSTCSAAESCRSCPGDCTSCPVECGDFACDPGETCPGDC